MIQTYSWGFEPFDLHHHERRNMLPPLPRPAQLRPPKTGGQSYPIPAIALLHGGFCTPDVAWITAVPGPHHPGADTANVGCEEHDVCGWPATRPVPDRLSDVPGEDEY